MSSWQSLFGCVGPSGKFLVCKLYICITKGKEKYPKDHLCTDFG